jgi:hypothetical protein
MCVAAHGSMFVAAHGSMFVAVSTWRAPMRCGVNGRGGGENRCAAGGLST